MTCDFEAPPLADGLVRWQRTIQPIRADGWKGINLFSGRRLRISTDSFVIPTERQCEQESRLDSCLSGNGEPNSGSDRAGF